MSPITHSIIVTPFHHMLERMYATGQRTVHSNVSSERPSITQATMSVVFISCGVRDKTSHAVTTVYKGELSTLVSGGECEEIKPRQQQGICVSRIQLCGGRIISYPEKRSRTIYRMHVPDLALHDISLASIVR